MNEIALSVNELEFGHKKALFHALSFCCRRGEVLAILGANGRGKTSLLNTLSGVIPPLAEKYHAVRRSDLLLSRFPRPLHIELLRSS